MINFFQVYVFYVKDIFGITFSKWIETLIVIHQLVYLIYLYGRLFQIPLAK